MSPDNGRPADDLRSGSAGSRAGGSHQMWPLTTRQRLLLSCRILRDHGIMAGPAVGNRLDGQESARMQMLNAIWHRNPAATASYMFWYSDDESAFTADGSLRHPLALLHSGAVGRAVQAALARVGLHTVEIDGNTMHLEAMQLEAMQLDAMQSPPDGLD